MEGMKIRSFKPNNNQIEKVCDIINIHERVWNEDILKEHISKELWEIKKIFRSQSNQEDRIIWYHDKKWKYTIKFEYYMEVSHDKENNLNNTNDNAAQQRENNNKEININSQERVNNNIIENQININNETNIEHTNRTMKNNINRIYTNINNPNQNNNSQRNFPWGKLWQLNILPKIKDFIWKACNNALPTRDNLIKGNINVEPICPICNGNNESILRNLVTCPRVEQVWHASMLTIRSSWLNVNTFKEWLNK